MKPIAVLLLVLVAVGALIFGLFTLGGGKGGKGSSPVGPEPVQGAPKSASKPPAEIEKTPDATARTADPAAATEDRTSVGDFVYANELRALVVDAQHKPIPDVEVTLTTLSSNDLFFIDSAIPAYQVGPLRTGSDGRVSFVGVEPNHTSYTLVCVHPDYARQERSTVPIGQEGVFEEPPIVLTGGATLQGTVKDELGSPVAGAKMVLEGLLAAVQQSRAPDRQMVTTDASGVYMIKNIPRGAQRSLSISAPGFGRLVQHGLNFPDTRPKSMDFVLKVAEMINGRVVGTGNQPLADVSLMALGVNGTLQTARDDQKSNERGEFQFENLVPGEYNIIATLKGWRFTPQNRVRTNTANLVFEGQRMPSVCGQVVDAASGAPVAQFNAQLRGFTDAMTPTAPLPESQAAFSDAGGNYCLEGVVQGSYVVEAWAPGYAPSRSEHFQIGTDRNMEHVTVKLTRGGSISGRVVDANNKPVAKALLRTRPVDWGEDEFTSSIDDIFPSHATRVEARTDANGGFTLKGLSPDEYQVLIDASGFARSTRTNLTVSEGGTTSLGDVKMERGGTLVGTVFDAAGKGVAGAGVTLMSADSATPREFRTKSGMDGKYTLRNIPQGRYRARPTAPVGPEPANPLEDLRVGADAERQITIADEQESKLELTLPVPAPLPDNPVVPDETPARPQPENPVPVKRP